MPPPSRDLPLKTVSAMGKPPLLLASSREEFEQMEDELATVAVFVGYFHDWWSFWEAVAEIDAHGGMPDGNYWREARGTVFSLWDYNGREGPRKEVFMK